MTAPTFRQKLGRAMFSFAYGLLFGGALGMAATIVMLRIVGAL